jgi:paraquat-inducible protein B
MSKKINTTSIGLFIVAGVALGVTCLLLFSTSKLFSKTRDVIVYFNDSLNGLNEGAPVKLRGVTIGSVKRVMVRFNQANNDYTMPVILQLEEKLVRERLGDRSGQTFLQRTTEERIKSGLRASLQTESLVTGVLYVDCRFNPNAPPPVFHQLTKIYPEWPTEPTQIQQLFNNLASLDIKSLQTNLNGLITRLDQTVGELKMAEISQGLTNVLTSVDRLINSPDITNGLAGLRPTLDQYRDLGAKLTNKIDILSASITNSLAEANLALAQIRGAGENLRTMLGPDSPTRNDLDQALQQIANTAQSISALVDFLKRNPNALIVGREILPKKP